MKLVLVGMLLAVLLSAGSFGQSSETDIIPRPHSVTRDSSSLSFELTKKTKIVVTQKDDGYLAKLLNQYLASRHGFSLKVTSKLPPEPAVVFGAVPGQQQAVLKDGYTLLINDKLIGVNATTDAGRFYGLQSLLQLFPNNASVPVRLPQVVINDAPRFQYRGMHLDVARHFMPIEFVKKYIDLMSQYKFNYFHWHLTEDQGWRIEIKKYPRLTEIGSKRPETVKERNLTPYIGDGIPHGGFYTQKEIKEVIEHAKARHITVIPEIELPGHASAALAAYPQYGCKADYKYKVQTTWGIFKEVYCPTDETFKFLEDILEETIALFKDSPYIHIGGDEVLKDHWKESAFVQELKKRENLKDEHEVQSYFVRRIERFINSKGKKMIGWDEILEGGLAPNATVMSWRGMKGGIEAAKAKHDVIMTPTDYAYFDYGQGDPAFEPLNIGSYVPMQKVYSFEPVPKELTAEEARFIIGGQANVWTEYLKTPANVEYMAFPRMLALSEVLWSRPEDRNYEDFLRRLDAHLPRLDAQGVNYRIPEPGGLRTVVTEADKVTIVLKTAPGMRVHYTTDGSTPDERSPTYTQPLEIALIEHEPVTLKTIVVNAAGRKSVVYAATLFRDRMRDPVELAETKQGIKYDLFLPRGTAAGEGDRKTGETKSIFLNQFANQGVDLKRPFAVAFDGYLRIPSDGLYEFQIDSTWDATLVVDGETIIDDRGTKDRRVKSVTMPLKAGLHQISIRYNHGGGDAAFRFRYGLKGQGLRQAGGGEFVF